MTDSAYAQRMADHPIAIVGLGSIFPQADDISEFWSNVTFGRDAVTDVPPAWWDPAEHFDPNPLAEDKTYARRGGFISPQTFDPRAFGMTPNSLDSVGLVQLLSLAVARDTLADAVRGREGWYPPDRTGVILGMAGVSTTLIPLAARLYAPALSQTLRELGHGEDVIRAFRETFLASLPSWTEDSFPGTLGNVVAGRIANRLDLRAANHTVDAACASSLAAVRAAVDELLTHRADVMITGGCDADNSIVSFFCFSKTPALSPSGRVRPFDTAADGTLLGEGLGMLALKRLADAERDGDRGRPAAFVRLADLVRARDGGVQPVDAGHRARRTGRPPRRGHRPAPHAGCRLPHAPAPPAVVGGPPATVLRPAPAAPARRVPPPADAEPRRTPYRSVHS